MTRYAAILAALRIAAPHFLYMREAALLLDQLEDRYHVRAELVIVIARHESRWKTGVVNPSSGTVGLLQMQPFNFRSCRETGDLASQPCQDTASYLSDWTTNLRLGVAAYSKAREYCVAHGHGARAQQWLQMPTGFDKVQGATCGYKHGKRLPVPKMVLDLLREASQLGWTKKTGR